jgi:hypothetical protein
MKLSDVISTIEQHRALKKAAGDKAWASLELKDRIGWGRHPCSIYMDENKENLIVEFTDNIEGYQTLEVVLKPSDLEDL